MLKPNQRVGEYVLSQRIGAGAFGEVWCATHHAWTDQVVAIKVPSDPQFARNLHKEGFAIHKLSHPNIVKPLAFDPYGDPAYLVMEFVPGTSLRSLLAHGKLRVDHALNIIKQVLAGLAHAHKHGLVHRDVKPENILIHKDVEKKGFAPGIVKVTDFGLGKSTAAENPNSIVLSQEHADRGPIAGSAPYMAPEQREGGEVDGRADLYACGVVLFEMLTGHRPAGLELPSDLNPDVPKSVDDLVRRALARLDRRYASAEEFVQAIVAAVAAPKRPDRTAERPADRPTNRTIAAPPPAEADDAEVSPRSILADKRRLDLVAKLKVNLGCLVLIVICILAVCVAIAGWNRGWQWTGLGAGLVLIFIGLMVFGSWAEEPAALQAVQEKLRERLKRKWFYTLPTAEQDRLQAWAQAFDKARRTDKKDPVDAEYIASRQHGAVPDGFADVVANGLWRE